MTEITTLLHANAYNLTASEYRTAATLLHALAQRSLHTAVLSWAEAQQLLHLDERTIRNQLVKIHRRGLLNYHCNAALWVALPNVTLIRSDANHPHSDAHHSRGISFPQLAPSRHPASDANHSHESQSDTYHPASDAHHAPSDANHSTPHDQDLTTEEEEGETILEYFRNRIGREAKSPERLELLAASPATAAAAIDTLANRWDTITRRDNVSKWLQTTIRNLKTAPRPVDPEEAAAARRAKYVREY